MKQKEIYLSIVITQYNELKNLEEKKVMERLDTYLQKQNYTWEVIVNDDGSTDGSYEFMKKFTDAHAQFKVIKGDHGGKAAGLLNGIKEAQGEITCTTDIDMSTPISEIEKLLPYFEQDFEAVIGSRGKARENFSLFRKLASFLFGVFRKTFVLRKIDDTQCGFKAYKTYTAQKFFPKLDAVHMKVEGWTVTAFDVELLFMLQQASCQIKEVPIQWRDEDISDTKDRDGKFIKESLDMAQQIFQVRLNWMKGKYKTLKCAKN